LFFIKCYWYEKIVKKVMGEKCRTYGSNEEYQIAVVQIEGKRPLRKTRRTLEANVKTTGLGGEMVSVLATGSKFCRFKPSRGDGFLMAIKIRSTPSF
jgi:putative component of membrane protein insertase Oxa1/YidC/SpoIIIJ protein YidD